jgi:hypothetical protein
MKPSSPRAIVYSAINVIAAIAVYRYLISGGWLTNHYHLDDPNIVNLALAIFEPIAFASVVAYWIAPKRFLYRTMSSFAVIQIVIGLGFLSFLLFFMFTWHPKMM